ncbi:hypothetical protein CK203_023658 [Vitis vinifera]|uniref:Uncharacterized protein n=1 Tax=Vitis vinifera TaxID=29760 RepID=A0A438JC13_VITVI|nr:hypothetical protein CK203_023658 [Vitis vinifera]
MVAPTKIIAGLGLSLGIDILEAPGATGDYRTLLISKATAIAKALSAPLQSCPSVFVPGEDEHKPAEQMAMILGFSTLSLSCVQQLRYPWGLTVKFMIFRICHDKASIFKVKAMEAVDTAIGQLSHLQCVGFGEVAAARGCLRRFSGSEMIGIVQTYLKLKA